MPTDDKSRRFRGRFQRCNAHAQYFLPFAFEVPKIYNSDNWQRDSKKHLPERTIHCTAVAGVLHHADIVTCLHICTPTVLHIHSTTLLHVEELLSV